MKPPLIDTVCEIIEHRAPWDKARVLWRVPTASAAEVAAATAAAKDAWVRDPGRDISSRAADLRTFANLLRECADSLADQITSDVGKPITMARAEVRRSAELLSAVASRAVEPPKFPSGPQAYYRYQPLGVIGVITPWNNPIAIPLGKIAPALLYGNAVVWKPAPPGSMIAKYVLDLLRQSGGLGDLVQLCIGDHGAARTIAEDPRVEGISLSGSLQAGHALQEICNRRHVPFQGELGGNNAAIVCGDCDLGYAASQIAAAAFGFAGQRCTANRRAVVAEEIFDAFIGQLRMAVRSLKWGDPFDQAMSVGPLISTQKRDAIAELIERSRSTGMQVLMPHSDQPDHDDLLNRGAYHPPAIVIADDPDHEIVQEETFGPVLVVQRARTFDQAVELVNGVAQGLAAALFSESPARRQQFLNEVRAGILKLNCGTADADAISPFGGWKASGIGPAEHGPSDREFFTRAQTIYDDQSPYNSTI